MTSIERVSRVDARTRFDGAIARGEMPLGAILTSVDPSVTALFGQTGYDFVIVDAEHGIFGVREVLAHVQSAERTGLIPLVRILAPTRHLVQQALDLGAAGVVVPKAESAESVRELVRGTQYAPGGRGYCPSVPAADWTSEGWAGYSSSANENVLLVPLIETGEGVRNAADIAALDGVDYVFFGIADLAQDMGLGLRTDIEALRREWEHVRDAVHAAGARVGAPLGFGLEGADFGTGVGDLGLLRQGLVRQLGELRERLWMKERGRS